MEIGNTINHSRYGAGTITAIEGENVTVQFEMFGSKTLAASALSAGTRELSNEVVTREISKSAAKKWAAREMVISEVDGLIADLEMWGSATQQRNGDTAAIIFTVSSGTGFAADVAKTCLKYGKVSQKQAAIIAKAYLAK